MLQGLLRGVTTAGTTPVTTDPFFSSVVLLMGFEGADASTGAPGMNDESPSARGTATVTADAQIDTADFKYGTSSLKLDGALDKIAFADSTDWQFSGQFTIEAWVKWNLLPINSTVVAHADTISAYGWRVIANNAGGLIFQFDNNGDGVALYAIGGSGGAVVVTGQWYHIAVDRDAADKLRLYKDGVMVASQVAATGTSFDSTLFTIGQTGTSGSTFMNGWIDEIRITNGAARYATDGSFTPPTAAFPRS